MEIHLDNYLLCSGQLTDERVGPSGMVLNGESIEDPATFFHALAQTIFARGGEKVELQFRVQRSFSSVRLAQKFVLTHRQDIPRDGRIKIVVGEVGDTEDIYLEGAIVQPTFPTYRGTIVIVNYAIRGGMFSTDVGDPLPAPDEEEEEVKFRGNIIEVDSGEDEIEITFSSPFATRPKIPKPSLAAPVGQPAIECWVIAESVTTTGFTAKFDAATPTDGYEFHYTAFGT